MVNKDNNDNDNNNNYKNIIVLYLEKNGRYKTTNTNDQDRQLRHLQVKCVREY